MLHWLRKILGLQRPASAGERAEHLAAAWLARERGFVVVARNWRNPRDQREEIDLVCQNGEVLVFVEVKARGTGALVPGYYAVDARKKRVLRRAIKAYLARLLRKPPVFRFDIVEVGSTAPITGEPERPSGDRVGTNSGEPPVLHFENVPLFTKHFRA